MKSVVVNILLFLACTTAYVASGQDNTKVPDYKGLVNDFAGVLSANQVNELTSILRKFEDSTTNQIAIVTENGLNGKPASDRAMEIARQWKIGSKENNNGVILYISFGKNQEDRAYYTLVSQALQGKLTDGVVGQIERQYLLPNLKSGKIHTGISATVSAYMQQIDGEFKAGKKSKKKSVPGWITIFMILGFMAIIGFINNRRFGRGYRRNGAYWFPITHWGGNSGSSWGGGSSGGDWGGFGGGGGFDGGGAGGSW